MNDLISRQAILDMLEDINNHIIDGYGYKHDWCVEWVKGLPSIDAVKHGIWIEENTRPRSSQFYCSVCHRTAYDPQPTRIAGWVKRCRYAYCPNCGADMRERKEQ